MSVSRARLSVLLAHRAFIFPTARPSSASPSTPRTYRTGTFPSRTGSPAPASTPRTTRSDNNAVRSGVPDAEPQTHQVEPRVSSRLARAFLLPVLNSVNPLSERHSSPLLVLPCVRRRVRCCRRLGANRNGERTTGTVGKHQPVCRQRERNLASQIFTHLSAVTAGQSTSAGLPGPNQCTAASSGWTNVLPTPARPECYRRLPTLSSPLA